MADDVLRFRCYQCNKLLGAPTRKAGRTITCPNCKADLIVPTPTDEPQLAEELRNLAPPSDEPAVAAPSSNAADSPTHDPAFSWEKIDTTIFESATVLTATDLPQIELNDSPAIETAEFIPADLINLNDSKPSPAPPSPTETIDPTTFRFDAPATQKDVLLIPPAKPGEAETPLPDMPDITVETPTVSAGPKLTSHRRREGSVVLAQSVLISWSLFVLLALAIAFVAGVFVGHFFWKQ